MDYNNKHEQGSLMAAQPWRWFIKDLAHIFNDTTHDLERRNHFFYAFLARNLANALIDNNRRATTLYRIYSIEGNNAKECSDLVIEAYVDALKNVNEYKYNADDDNAEHKQNDCNITKIIVDILQTKKPSMLRKKGSLHTISIKDSIKNYVKEQAMWKEILQQQDGQNAFNNFCANSTAWEHLTTLIALTKKIRTQHDKNTPFDSEKIVEIFDYFQEKAAFRISHPHSDYLPLYYNPQSECASPLNQKGSLDVVHHPYIQWRAATTPPRAAGDRTPRETKTDDLAPSSARSYSQAHLTVTIESPEKSPRIARRGTGIDNLILPVSARSHYNVAQQTAINHALPDEKTLNPTRKMTPVELENLKSQSLPQRYPMPTFRNTIGFYALNPFFWIHAIMDAVVRGIFKIVNYVACSYKNSLPVVFFKGILALIFFPPYIIVHGLAKLTTLNGIIATGKGIKDLFCDDSSQVSRIEEKIETSLSRQQAISQSNRSSTPRPARQTTLTQNSTSSQPSDLYLSPPPPYLTPPSHRHTGLHSPSAIHNGLGLFAISQPMSPAPSPEPSARATEPTHVSISFDRAEANVNAAKPKTDVPVIFDDYPEPGALPTTPPTHSPVDFYPRRPRKTQYNENPINTPQADEFQPGSLSMSNASG